MLFTLIVAVALPAGAIYVLAKNALDTLPWRLVAYGRRIIADDRGRLNDSYAKPLYVGEGMNSSVAVTELSDGQTRRFHVSGKVEASSLPEDMRLQLMLGHFPALFHPKPEKVLIVGCGAGVTAGSFILHPSIKKIVICEIEPLVPKVVATYFGPQNNNVVTRKADGSFVDDRVEVVYDDARHYILTTREKFDIITSDPIHPWVKGAATLYTEDYFNLVKAHLNPGGIVTQWVPLYESSEPAVKSEIATFSKVFPNATLWNNDDNGAGYDTVILGSNSDYHIDAAALERRLQQTMIISATLARSSFGSAVDILKTYAGEASDLGPWMQDAQINRDRNLRLQYLAGDSLNENAATEIIDRIMSYRKFPKEMLIADPETQRTLERSWRVPQTSGALDLPGNSAESPPAAP
jgi:spermidine synthase